MQAGAFVCHATTGRHTATKAARRPPPERGRPLGSRPARTARRRSPRAGDHPGPPVIARAIAEALDAPIAAVRQALDAATAAEHRRDKLTFSPRRRPRPTPSGERRRGAELLEGVVAVDLDDVDVEQAAGGGGRDLNAAGRGCGRVVTRAWRRESRSLGRQGR